MLITASPAGLIWEMWVETFGELKGKFEMTASHITFDLKADSIDMLMRSDGIDVWMSYPVKRAESTQSGRHT